MQELTIGRSPDNSIIINDNSVSRRHATLIVSQSEFSVKDLGSANGTFVNGMRVAGVSRLQSNDILKVGNSVVPWMNYINMGGHQVPSSDPQVPKPSSSSASGQVKLNNSTGALVTGIIGLVLIWLPIISLAGIVLNIIAIVLGAGALSAYKQDKDKYTEGSYKNAKAGLVCGIVGLSLVVLGIIILVISGVALYA
jgi:pSer/pThr/pTyr-binding forkhead associated (FHA) protein